MIIKHVTKNIKDVFLGEGWYSWARINLSQNRVVNSNLKMHKAFEQKLIQQCKTLSK